MIIVHSGISLLQTIQATCFENTKHMIFQLDQNLILELLFTLLALVTCKLYYHCHWSFNCWMTPIQFESKCSIKLCPLRSNQFKLPRLPSYSIVSCEIVQEKSASLLFLCHWGSKTWGSVQCLCRGLTFFSDICQCRRFFCYWIDGASISSVQS